MLNVGDVYSVTIEENNIFGNGICHIDNMVVFVNGAVNGDVCKIVVTKKYPKYAYADISCLEIPSPDRIKPECKVYEKCGGCTFSHMTLALENQVKESYVTSSFKKQGIDVDVEKITCPVSEKYRNKIVLFHTENGFGYNKQGTNEIVPHSTCQLNPDAFDNISAFTHKNLNTKALRALYLRKASGDGEIMVCLILYKEINLLDYIGRLINEFPAVTTVLTSICKDKEIVLEKLKFKKAYGDGYITDTICDVKFRISPESFYQINHTCAQLLYEKAIELASLSEKSKCADLFCGTGTIGIISASKTGAQIFGVEIVEEAIEDAKYNARLNGIKNITLKAMDASKFDECVDTCIIDPPRKGCLPIMLETLKRLSPNKIVYVSCNADTMARDIKELIPTYKISSPVFVFNLFPRTSHVESVVCLKRQIQQ